MTTSPVTDRARHYVAHLLMAKMVLPAETDPRRFTRSPTTSAWSGWRSAGRPAVVSEENSAPLQYRSRDCSPTCRPGRRAPFQVVFQMNGPTAQGPRLGRPIPAETSASRSPRSAAWTRRGAQGHEYGGPLPSEQMVLDPEDPEGPGTRPARRAGDAPPTDLYVGTTCPATSPARRRSRTGSTRWSAYHRADAQEQAHLRAGWPSRSSRNDAELDGVRAPDHGGSPNSMKAHSPKADRAAGPARQGQGRQRNSRRAWHGGEAPHRLAGHRHRRPRSARRCGRREPGVVDELPEMPAQRHPEAHRPDQGRRPAHLRLSPEALFESGTSPVSECWPAFRLVAVNG